MSEKISAELRLYLDKFKTEVLESTSGVSKLEQQFSAAFSSIDKKSESSVSAVISQLAKLDSKFKQTLDEKRFSNFSKAFESIGQKASETFSGGLNIGAGFESEITKIAAISDIGGKQLETFAERIRTLGRDFDIAVGPTESAAVALQAVGSGFESTSASTEIAKNSLLLIADGTTNATAATKLLTGALNSYGQGADQAGKFTDIFFQLQNRGVTTIAELSQSLALVTPVAAQSGVGLEELAASLSVVTRNGVPTSSAVEGLRGLLTSLINPTEEGRKALSRYGLSIDFTTLKSKGLGGTLAEIQRAIGGNKAALQDIAGSQQAFAIANSLLGDSLKSYNTELGFMQNSQGAAKRSTDILAGSFNQSRKAFDASIERFQVGATKAILPAATAIVKFATTIFDAFDKIPEPIKTFGLALTGASAAIAGILATTAGLGKVISLLGIQSAGVGASIVSSFAGVGKILSTDLKDVGKAASGAVKSLGDLAKTGIKQGVTNLSSAFSALFPSVTATGLAIAGTVAAAAGLGIAISAAYSSAFNDIAKFNSELLKSEQGFSSLGRQVTEVSKDLAISSSVGTLVDIGVTGEDIRSRIASERNKLDKDDEEARKKRLADIEKLKKVEEQVRLEVEKRAKAQVDAEKQSTFNEERYKDELQLIEVSKAGSQEKINQLNDLKNRYALSGDERRAIERKVFEEEKKLSAQRKQEEKKSFDERFRQSIQEIENSKKPNNEKINELKALSKLYQSFGNERRSIEDKILAYEKKIASERVKLNERTLKGKIEDSQENLKSSEFRSGRLDKIEEKGLDVTPARIKEAQRKAKELSIQVDLGAEQDKAKTTDQSEISEIEKRASREKANIARELEAELSDIKERGESTRLDRAREFAQKELQINEFKMSELAKAAEAGKVSQSFFEQQALAALEVKEREIKLNQEIEASKTKDPSRLEQIRIEAEQKLLEAKRATREEIEQTTKAIEEQLNKSKQGESSEFSGRILSFEEFLSGENSRFSDTGRQKQSQKKTFIPGLSDLESRISRETIKDPTRRTPGIVEDLSAQGSSVDVNLSGEFVLLDSSGKEVGKLSRLSVNGRNGELNKSGKLDL